MIFTLGVVNFAWGVSTEVTPVYYLNLNGLRDDLVQYPSHHEGRIFIGDSELSQEVKSELSELTPLFDRFPRAVFTEQKLSFHSDDNCTMVPNRLWGLDLWKACRRHDYCYSDLGDYENQGLGDVFRDCNQKLKVFIQDVCGDRNCEMIKKVFFVGVSSFSESFRNFISHQSKQALFLSEVLRTSKNPERIMDVKETKRKLKAFCRVSAEWSQNHKYRWDHYLSSPRDQVPLEAYHGCEDFQGTQIVKGFK
jgi:hypothetical protein